MQRKQIFLKIIIFIMKSIVNHKMKGQIIDQYYLSRFSLTIYFLHFHFNKGLLLPTFFYLYQHWIQIQDYHFHLYYLSRTFSHSIFFGYLATIFSFRNIFIYEILSKDPYSKIWLCSPHYYLLNSHVSVISDLKNQLTSIG